MSEQEEFEFRHRFEQEQTATAVADPPLAKPKNALLREVAGAYTEPLLALGTGALAAPVSGLAGLASAATGGDAGKTVHDVGSALTYQPRTESGKRILDVVTTPFQWLGKGARIAGEKVMDVTGSQTAGTIADTALQLLPMFAGKMKPNAAISKTNEVFSNVRDYIPKAVGGKSVQEAAKHLNARHLRKMFPRESDRQAALATLEREANPLATVSEAVHELPQGSNVAAYQKFISGTQEANPAFNVRAGQRQTAREAIINQLAEGKSVKTLLGERTAASAPKYQTAMQEVVKVDPTLQGILASDTMKEAMKKATKIMSDEGITLPKSGKGSVPIEQLHRAKQYLGDIIKKPEEFGFKATEGRSIAILKDRLTKWIDDHSPAYQEARRLHAEKSGPFNRAQVREELSGKYRALTGEETPGAFIRAVEDSSKIIKDAIGNPRYKQIEDILTAREAGNIRGLTADLEREYTSKHPKVPARAETTGTVTETFRPDLPNILARPITGTEWLLRERAENIIPYLNQEAGQALLNPRKMAEILRNPKLSQREAIIHLLANRAPIASTYAGVVGGRADQ